MLEFLAESAQSAIGPLVAVLVAVGAQIFLMRRDEKRQLRRAFAEAMDQCCDVLETTAVRYWAGDDSKTEVLVGTMNATLIKMNRLVLESSCMSGEESGRLISHWKVIRKELRRNFGVANRRIDLERMTIVVGIILGVRCESAKLKA